MLIRRPSDINGSEITPRGLYLDRRRFIASAGAAGIGAGLGIGLPGLAQAAFQTSQSKYSTIEKQTPKDEIASYNNYYEFGVDKDDPKANAQKFRTSPWAIQIEGAVAKPGKIGLEDILKGQALEDRVYRMRCVEGWSMVIPWVGFPLSDLLKKVEPTSKAKYVAFETIFDPDQMIGQNRKILDWPYVEGLRIDEAMHPLTLLAVGLYGDVLPNQNGAPIRLVVPWKYGFKGIKAIVKIRLQEEQPQTSWKNANAREYGFYSNVNPDVDHPRWSQKTERRIGEFRRRDTLPFNGYAEEVASLYSGQDLRKDY